MNKEVERNRSCDGYRNSSQSELRMVDAMLLLNEHDIIVKGINGESGDVVHNLGQIDVKSPYIAELTLRLSEDKPEIDVPLLDCQAYPVNPISEVPAQLYSVQHNNIGEAFSQDYDRPQYIYVKIFKSSPNESIGLSLEKDRGRICVSNICAESVLSRTPLRSGDEIVSVNGQCCRQRSVEHVAHLIHDARDSIALCVRNPNGDSNLFSSCVQKPRRDVKVGIHVRSERGTVVINRVHDDGLLAGSFLTPGHRCLEVNGIRCDAHFRPSEVAQIITEAPELVTIVSRPLKEYAVVISSTPNRKWWRTVSIRPVGLAVGMVNTKPSR